jgi:cell division protein FtsW
VAGVGSLALAATMALTSVNRMGRIQSWLAGCTDPNKCFQTIHGQYALADGGWWGVGLGASREKWMWLPEAHNDFIFAIIGEELGLPGTLVVIALFGLLAFACFRLVLRSKDFFVRVATAGVMVWILAQAVINIGSVIGLLPVIGVPLPLVSSGGSALMATMFALGMLLSFARNEPGCREALAARPGVVRRSMAVMPTRRGRSS